MKAYQRRQTHNSGKAKRKQELAEKRKQERAKCKELADKTIEYLKANPHVRVMLSNGVAVSGAVALRMLQSGAAELLFRKQSDLTKVDWVKSRRLLSELIGDED